MTYEELCIHVLNTWMGVKRECYECPDSTDATSLEMAVRVLATEIATHFPNANHDNVVDAITSDLKMILKHIDGDIREINLH